MTLVERDGKARFIPCRERLEADVIANHPSQPRPREPPDDRRSSRYATLGESSPITAPLSTRVTSTDTPTRDGEKINTNTVEGYYSVFKRGMIGVYQHCSEQHLHRYLAEFISAILIGKARLRNTERAPALQGVKGKRLTYETTAQSWDSE